MDNKYTNLDSSSLRCFQKHRSSSSDGFTSTVHQYVFNVKQPGGIDNCKSGKHNGYWNLELPISSKHHSSFLATSVSVDSVTFKHNEGNGYLLASELNWMAGKEPYLKSLMMLVNWFQCCLPWAFPC